jgi:vanillate O-demethylase ferredoxin subunit
VVSVNKDPASLGGSKHVHEQLRVSDRLVISPPRNNFPLDETANHSDLIAGGIGITPLKAMIARLDRIGRSWELFYATRNRPSTAFIDELQRLEDERPGGVHFHFSAEANGTRLGLKAMVAAALAGHDAAGRGWWGRASGELVGG